MPPTITTQTHALVSGAEVSFGIIAGGPFDSIDVYVDGSANAQAKLFMAEWRLYATNGGLTSLVASAPGGGAAPAVLDWNVGSTGVNAPYSPAKAVGTTYELRALWINPGGLAPPNFKASLVGYNEFDIAADAAASATVAVPPTGETVIATLGGYAQVADVSVDQNFDVPITIKLYAVAGGITALVAAILLDAINSVEPITRVLSPKTLPGATSYVLAAAQAGGAAAVNVTASLATRSTIVTGGGVLLAGNTNGPSNANTEQSFVTSTPNANVNVAAQAKPSGDIYEGLNGLTANRTVFLNTTATGTIGDNTTVKDEDGSLALWNIIVDPGAGNTIDGAATYTMTAAQNGIKGSATFKRIGATAWAVV